jgi:SEC-C motif-containing protein
MDLGSPCPCGIDIAYAGCCARFHHGSLQAATPEELMRSRYSAYVAGDANYIFRTWHPRTRPEDVELDQLLRWVGLEIIDVDGAEVEFVAHFEALTASGWEPDELHERSLFEQRAGRWFYVSEAPADRAAPDA